MTTSTRLERSFVITRRLPATTDRVFAAWTEPAQLDRWFAHLPPAVPTTVDLRVGGCWQLEMVETPQRRYLTGGTYREIDAPGRLVFSWGVTGGWPEFDPERPDDVPLVTVDLSPAGAETDMRVTMSLAKDMSDDDVRHWFDLGIKGGMTQTVDRILLLFGDQE
jgi:uncharacterized protein YndB with AHSA1/START domain